MGPVAKALIVIALGLEELAEVWLAVDVVVQGGIVRQTGQKGNRKEDIIRNLMMPSNC